jgi:hypothetical protein
MAAPSVTHTFTNGTTADATQVNTNFDDIIQALTDGTSDLTFNLLTANGAATFNGAVTLGNATGDDITITGRVASHVDPKTASTYDLGDATQLWRAVYSNDFFADIGAVGTPSHSFHADTDTGMWSPGANTLAWSVGGTEAARITSARYLGIGTTAPQGWLDVRGTGEATGTIGAVFVTSDNAGSEYATNDLIGKIVFGGTADSATEYEAAGIFAYASGGWSSDSDTPSGLQFKTIPDASNTLTERMRLDGAGQLGLGTTAPQGWFHVEGTGEATGTIGSVFISSDNTGAAYGTNDLLAKIAFGGRDSDAEEYEAASIVAFAAGLWPSDADTPSGLAFYTIADGTNTLAEKMRLDSEGRLAINTVAPSSLVDATWDDTTNYTATFTNDAAAGSSRGLRVNAGGNSSDHCIRAYQRDSTTELFAVMGNGQITMNLGNWGSSSTQDVGASVTTGIGQLQKFTSSRRYKKDIRDLEEDTSWIYQTRPVNFTFINDAPDAMASKSLGYIAEELSEIAPKEFVFWDERHEDGPREESLHYKLFTIPIIEEMKKLKMEIEHLRTLI